MHGLTIVKSLLVRVLLIIHGLICAWRVVQTNENQYCWVILVGLVFLFFETGIVIHLRNGREFKTVAFCIIFYLTCVVPAFWIIHVETANRKLYHLVENKMNALSSNQIEKQNTLPNNTINSDELLHLQNILSTSTPLVLSLRNIDCDDEAWYHANESHWLDVVQETLFIVLTICRLTISHQQMKIEKYGVILIVTLMNTADLLAVSRSLQYHDVIIERIWMYIGLIICTIGLIQMAFIDTEGFISISYKSQSFYYRHSSKQIRYFQDQNFYPFFRSLFIYDGLFLLYRILLIAKVRCSKPSIVFFMSKNMLMIAFHCYRVYNLVLEQNKKKSGATYEKITTPISTSSSTSSMPSVYSASSHYRRQYYGFNRKEPKLEVELLHRTIRRSSSIGHRRRKAKTPRAFYNYTPSSISYPFARRRNDGGRARTAFALYGLPFHTPKIVSPTTISSDSSLLAKALVH